MVTGLAVIDGVFTSACTTPGALPLVSMGERGLLVALGVLMDAVIVHLVVAPALTFELGDRIWWPSAFPAADEANSPSRLLKKSALPQPVVAKSSSNTQWLAVSGSFSAPC